MTNLKTLFHSGRLDQKGFVMELNATSKYPVETIEAYNKIDIGLVRPKKQKPRKHNSVFRTVSDRKWAGHKNNKPKHGWSKKRKALMEVWL